MIMMKTTMMMMMMKMMVMTVPSSSSESIHLDVKDMNSFEFYQLSHFAASPELGFVSLR